MRRHKVVGDHKVGKLSGEVLLVGGVNRAEEDVVDLLAAVGELETERGLNALHNGAVQMEIGVDVGAAAVEILGRDNVRQGGLGTLIGTDIHHHILQRSVEKDVAARHERETGVDDIEERYLEVAGVEREVAVEVQSVVVIIGELEGAVGAGVHCATDGFQIEHYVGIVGDVEGEVEVKGGFVIVEDLRLGDYRCRTAVLGREVDGTGLGGGVGGSDLQHNAGTVERLQVGAEEADMVAVALDADIARHDAVAIEDRSGIFRRVEHHYAVGMDAKVYVHILEEVVLDAPVHKGFVATLVLYEHIVEEDALAVEPDVLVLDVISGAQRCDAHLHVNSFDLPVEVGGLGVGVE